MYKRNNQITKLMKITILALIVFATPLTSYARDVTFEWTANPEPLSGYKLYYKTGDNSSPPFDGKDLYEGNSPIFIDKITTFTVTGLLPDVTYHFTLTAYNEIEESSFSTIVTVAPQASPSPTIIKISAQ